MLKRISRNTNQAGPDKFHVYNCFVNYKTPDGLFEKIDPEHVVLDGSGLVRARGVIQSRFAGKSVRFASDEATEPWTLTVSLKKIMVKKAGDFENLVLHAQVPAQRTKNPLRTKMAGGVFDVLTTGRGSRFLIPATSKVTDFAIDFTLTPRGGLKLVKKSDQVWFEYKGKTVMTLARPKLLDETLEIIGRGIDEKRSLIGYELKNNGNGTWNYKKIPGKDFVGAKLPETFWIDADVVYAESGSGLVGREDTSSWANRRDTLDGTYLNVTGTGYIGIFANDYITRGHAIFDCSALVGTVTDATVHVYSDAVVAPSAAILQKSTAALPLVYGDYSSMVGGIGGDVLSASFIPNAGGWKTIPITDLSYVTAALGTDLGIALVNYTYDYLNVDPGATDHYWYCYFTTTGKEMYIEITMEVISATNVMVI